jgi:hypothetical protein
MVGDNDMNNLDNILMRNLYRLTCPDSVELGEYHLGFLPMAKAVLVRAHVADCRHCAGELAQLDNFIEAIAPVTSVAWQEKVKVWVAKLMPDKNAGIKTGEMPAFSLRGNDDTPLTYEAGNAQLTFQIEDDPQQLGLKALLGLIIGIPTTNLQAHLWQNNQKLASIAVDKFGNFILAGLAAGQYELIVAGVDLEIHIQALTIT